MVLYGRGAALLVGTGVEYILIEINLVEYTMSVASDAIKDNKKVLLLALGLLVVSVFGLILTREGMIIQPDNLVQPPSSPNTYSQPNNVLEEGVDYKAVIKTSVGDIEVDLFEGETPQTVNSFVFLAGERFFDRLIFHRVIEGFVIQGGDPKGDGTGGPGYQIPDEITERKYMPYTLGMANAGPNTNGSQFFITSGNILEDNLKALDGGYTIFGKVTKGFAVVDSIERVETDRNDKPINPVVIEAVQIIEN
jgi:cyclophilin family peptidyl-prolyl cis-trans isomerase